MPTTLLIIYRILGAALFALAAAAIVEKYRTEGAYFVFGLSF